MTIAIDLPAELERELQRRAASNGLEVSAFLRQVIEEKLLSSRTPAEILAPFRQEVEQSGLTDDELETFFREVRDEVRADKQSGRGAVLQASEPRILDIVTSKAE